MLTLCNTLNHREKLLRCHIEDVMKDFTASMATLETDAFSPVRSAFIGVLMEETYRSAIAEYGTVTLLRSSNIMY